MENNRGAVCSVEGFLVRHGLSPLERKRHADLIVECAMREKQIHAAWERGTRAAEEFKGVTELVEEVTELMEDLTGLVKDETELVRKLGEAAQGLAECLAGACLRLLPEDRFNRE